MPATRAHDASPASVVCISGRLRTLFVVGVLAMMARSTPFRISLVPYIDEMSVWATAFDEATAAALSSPRHNNDPFSSSLLLSLSVTAGANARKHSGGKETSNQNESQHIQPPFLVTCGVNRNDPLFPMFSNFTEIRLDRQETPPPWDAPAILVPGTGKCMQHPYVVQAFARRQASPYVAQLPTWEFLQQQSMDTERNMTGGMGVWVQGVHWPLGDTPTKKQTQPFLRVARNRPLLLQLYNREVFFRQWYRNETCARYDLRIYRERETPGPDCLTIHFLQGVSTALMERGHNGPFGLGATSQMYQGLLPNPHKPNQTTTGSNALKSHYNKGKCSILVRWDIHDPVMMFNYTYKDADVLVRESFFRLMNDQYKNETGCTTIKKCPGSYYTSFTCFAGYKFHITMDNTQVNGYVSEKLFNGALGGGIPVYFGALDLDRYNINPESIVDCNVDPQIIQHLRSFYPRDITKGPGRYYPRPFLFSEMAIPGKPTNAELIQWADGILHPFFLQKQSCFPRLQCLDQNDEAYIKVLRQPFLTKPDIMTGEYPLRGVSFAYDVMMNNTIKRER